MMLTRTTLLIAVASLAACGGGVTLDGGNGGGSGNTGGGSSSAGGGAGSTGGGSAASAPIVTSSDPLDLATNIALNVQPQVTFSAEMAPTTFTTSTFSLRQGSTVVAGTVRYAGSTATFTPASNLATATTFTATVSTGVTDVGGLALAAPYSWSFTTGSTTALGPAPVSLGTAGNYVVLAKTAISTVPPSVLTGDVGISPAAQSFETGFSLVADSTNVFATSTQVTGKIYAANDAVPTPAHLTTAISNMEAAYTDAASRPTPDHLELLSGSIGGQTLAPGLYKWTSAITIASDLTISGAANDVWIFQTTGDITLAASKHIILSGGAQAKNVFWQVAGQATFGAGSHFEGVILCKTGITLQTGASMNGRALAQTEIALQQATLVQPAP